MENSSNKQMTGKEKGSKQKFFFPGGGIYPPMNIEAENEAEALAKYEKERKPYHPAPEKKKESKKEKSEDKK